MSNVKNYTEQGGEKTIIGGTLEIAEGGKVVGLPSAANQASSTATTVAGIKDDFNNLLKKLKDVLIMTPEAWNVSVAKIPTPFGENLISNHGKVTAINIEDGVITVAVPVSELIPFSSSNPTQGTHKWVGMAIATCLADITAIKYNGYQLTQEDASESAAVGCSAGDIVMWLKCDEIVDTPKIFTLWASGYLEATFTVVISEPVEE